MQTHNALAILTRIKRLFVARSNGARERGHHMPLARCLCRASVAALLVFLGQVCQAETDPDLQLLAEEVTKVEESPTEAVTVQEDATRLVAQSAHPAPSRKRFGELLREQHVGTHGFSSRLTERSREEIFVDYGNGASIATDQPAGSCRAPFAGCWTWDARATRSRTTAVGCRCGSYGG